MTDEQRGPCGPDLTRACRSRIFLIEESWSDTSATKRCCWPAAPMSKSEPGGMRALFVRPAAQDWIKTLIERGLHKPGYYVGNFGAVRFEWCNFWRAVRRLTPQTADCGLEPLRQKR